MSSAFENAMSDLQANNHTQQYPVIPFCLHDYEAIKAKQEATQRILDRRAAAGMCNSDDMAAKMNEARKAISARISEWDDCAACGHMRKCHDPACYVDDCNGTCTFIEPQDFSPANDAALFADQYDDWRDWQWSQGDLGL